MIKIESVEVVGWEHAIRGMRNPLNSWEFSDSQFCKGADGFEDCHVSPLGKCPRCENWSEDVYCVGKNDLILMRKLAAAGSDHRKFMRMITVYADIIAPRYWWTEYDTYKVGTVANSCSTMHKIADKELTIDDFSCEHLMDSTGSYDCLTVLVDTNGNDLDCAVSPYNLLKITIACLNNYRKRYLQTKDMNWWRQMIQLLPQSYNQRRTVMLNYEVLRNMYRARKDHKLDEWCDFCRWVETLPYSELITGRETCDDT